MANHSGAYAAAEDVQNLAITQGQHAVQIHNVETATQRVEEKLDKLLFLMLGSLGTAMLGLLVSLFRH